MKKLVLTLAVILAGISGTWAQGTIKMFNIASNWLISTNGNAYNGTTTGLLDKGANDFYFALLFGASPASSNPLTGGWTFATANNIPIVGNNYTVLAGGIFGTGGTVGTIVDGWMPGATENVEVVGWSASLGTSWSQVAVQLQQGYWDAAGYFGISAEGTVASGGFGDPPSSPATIFNLSGGIASGWDLNGVSSAPEPTTIALAGLGGLALLGLRRRK